MTLARIKPEVNGFIFDIQGLSVHDGPGCRTLIFFNGCSMNCYWCCNPEGISGKPSLMYFPSKCIGCGNCVNSCPYKAITIENEKIKISRQLCAKCERHECIDDCYTDALKLSGYEISVASLLTLITRDRQYWGSKGGVTLTGGEPLLQIDFATEILSACHEAYIHTAIETCGNVSWENYQKAIPYLDWIFFDLKHFNTVDHKRVTGVENTLILKNAKKLSKEFKGKLMFRLPLIPNFNDTSENIKSVISFLKEVGKNEINILPLHHLGKEKYRMLNKEYMAGEFSVPSDEHLRGIEKEFREAGINCYVGSETPF
jgi:glycyl-radical enzyme activating protein